MKEAGKQAANNYRHIWSEKRSLINTEAHLWQNGAQHRRLWGQTHPFAFLYARDGIAEEFHRAADNDQWKRQGRRWLDPHFRRRLFREGAEHRRTVAAFVANLNEQRLRKVTNEALTKLFVRANELYATSRSYFKTTRPEFLFAAEHSLKTILSTKLQNPLNAQMAFETLTTPTAFDEINKERRDWTRLLWQRNGSMLLLKHLRHYPWLTAQSHDESAMMQLLTQRYTSDRANRQKLHHEMESLEAEKRQLRRAQRILEKKFTGNRVRVLASLFRDAALERMRLKGWWAGADFLYLPMYQQIARRTNIPLASLYSFYRIHEVITAIHKHRPTVSTAELRRRKRAYVLQYRPGRIAFCAGKQADILIAKALRQMEVQTSHTLRGTIASSGVASGPVRVVIPGDIQMLERAMRDFQRGEVLVSTMTQPNMVPLMRKAVAVVTDEGGLASHAAIIARELKLPCIVGTQIATKVLKDGMVVTVDATDGVVKIRNSLALISESHKV